MFGSFDQAAELLRAADATVRRADVMMTGLEVGEARARGGGFTKGRCALN